MKRLLLPCSREHHFMAKPPVVTGGRAALAALSIFRQKGRAADAYVTPPPPWMHQSGIAATYRLRPPPPPPPRVCVCVSAQAKMEPGEPSCRLLLY